MDGCIFLGLAMVMPYNLGCSELAWEREWAGLPLGSSELVFKPVETASLIAVLVTIFPLKYFGSVWSRPVRYNRCDVQYVVVLPCFHP